MKVCSNSIIEALKTVRYPGCGKNIVELGMVADDIRVDGDKVSFSIVFEKVNDPFLKSVVRAAEAAVLNRVGAEVQIRGNIKTVVKQTAQNEPRKSLPGVKNIIAIASGKGGVGKSTVSTNLAIALAQAGYRVGLLDADIYGPSLPKMFGVEDVSPYMEAIDGREQIVPVQKYGVYLLSIGFFVNKDVALVWRGTMASNALKQLINDAYWGELDYFLMDLPPGTSDIHLTMVQTLAVTGVIIVTTPQEVALSDARKCISMFTGEKINVPVLGLVENMAWFTAAELPENRYYIFGKDGGKQLAEKMQTPLLGEIPIVKSICESGDNGTPIALNENSLTGKAFKCLARNLVEQVRCRNERKEISQRVTIKHH